MKKGMCILLFLIVFFAARVCEAGFIDDFNQQRYIYDYSGVVKDIQGMDSILTGVRQQYGASIYIIVTGGKESEDFIVSNFNIDSIQANQQTQSNGDLVLADGAGKKSCKIIVLYEPDVLIEISKSGCGSFSADNVLNEPQINALMNNGKNEEALRVVIDRIIKELRTLNIMPPAFGQMSEEDFIKALGDADDSLLNGDYELAYSQFQKVYENSNGSIKWLARYQQAQIMFYQQRYDEAIFFGEMVLSAMRFEEPILARAGLKIVILSHSALGQCMDVERTFNWWQNFGFENDSEVQQAVDFCRTGEVTDLSGEGKNPDKVSQNNDIKDYTNALLELKRLKTEEILSVTDQEFLDGKCKEFVSDNGFNSISFFEEAYKLDETLGKKAISALIKCFAFEEECNKAQSLYVVFTRYFGEDEEIFKAADSCEPKSPLVDFSNQLTFIKYAQPRPSEQQGSIEEIIKGMLNIGWDLYSKGMIEDARIQTSRIEEGYFSWNKPEHEENRNVYGYLWKSMLKLKILSTFLTPSEYRDCDAAGWIYIVHYQRGFGSDNDIEAAWDQCKGAVQNAPPVDPNANPAASQPQANQSPVNPNTDLCISEWPTDEGPKMPFNANPLNSCEMFETGTSKIDYVIDQARSCCENKGFTFDGPCIYAKMFSTLSDPDQNLKRCMGIYIIKGMGQFSKWMYLYFYPEVNCNGENPYVESYFKGKCDGHWLNFYSENAQALPCRPTRSIVWESDTDMSQNNCNAVTPPAHASLNILKTGTCADYSVVATTLLRRAGYSSNEVYSAEQVDPATNLVFHATNIVLFPGDKKYHFFDTTGGGRPFDIALLTDYSTSPYAYLERSGCMNDKGSFSCPSMEQVYGTNVKSFLEGIFSEIRKFLEEVMAPCSFGQCGS